MVPKGLVHFISSCHRALAENNTTTNTHLHKIHIQQQPSHYQRPSYPTRTETLNQSKTKHDN